MLTLNGTVANVFQAPKGTNKDGKEYGGQDRVQIMAQTELQNGETRLELVNLTVTNIRTYESLKGQQVRIPVGVFASGGSVAFYALKGAEPEPITEPDHSKAI
jgi:hypothetical protein